MTQLAEKGGERPIRVLPLEGCNRFQDKFPQ